VKGVTNATVLGMCVFILIVSGILFTLYNVNCPRYQEYGNTSYDPEELKIEWSDVVWNSKCEGLPSWYQLAFYTPILIIGGKSALTLT
jgi:quinol-cytochrome oxidoreductase complex cytochrome b subunit